MGDIGRRTLLRAALALAAFGQLVQPAFAQIPLPSGTVTPSAETTAQFLKSLGLSTIKTEHGLATFARHPTPEERKHLEASGVRLLSSLVGTTYRVRVEPRVNVRGKAFATLRTNLLRLEAQDRVHPRLWREDYPRYMLNADQTLTLSIRIHPGVSEAEARRVLAKHARRFAREGGQAWVTVVAQDSLRTLAAEDIVQWIDAGPLPFIADNDRVRREMKVDGVQRFDKTTGSAAGLSGKGVRVGVFDKGVDETHDDFAEATALTSRVAPNDAGQQFHATHVAGTIGGNGKLSTGIDSWGNSNAITNPPTEPYQWRGMATDVRLLDIDQMPPFGQNGKNPDTHARYIAKPGMDLSNHSYVFSVDGAYDASNQARDEIIRGDATSSDGSLVPPRLHVTSAGNGGLAPFVGSGVTSFQKGYFSLTKQVKNALVVGNWDIDAQRIARTSSLGPTHDGRIKPDVVAPGMAVRSTGYCIGPSDPDEKEPDLCKDATGVHRPRQDFYRVLSGTSIASAAASGVLALVLEQYVTTYAVKLNQNPPLPSTLRAVVIHAAVDKENSPSTTNPDGLVKDWPGPDFVTGWGLIAPGRAVDVVANRRLIEDDVVSACDSRVYTFTVPAGAATMRVTLAWDDVAADALLSAMAPTAPLLRNDLDLVLIDPGGGVHYPWQLDQVIVDPAGNSIPSEQQGCGMAIGVQRKFMPVSNPAAANESAPEASLPQAIPGPDHLNNVEVVDVVAPAAGTWRARVTGFSIPEGPQKFSLIGSAFVRWPGPKALCIQYAVLCQKVALRLDLCQRYPKLCEPRFRFPVPRKIHVSFDDGREKIVLPLDGICRHSAGRSEAQCTGYDLRVQGKAAPFRVEIYSASGQRLSRDISRKLDKQLPLPARADAQHFVVLSLGRGAKTGAELEVELVPK